MESMPNRGHSPVTRQSVSVSPIRKLLSAFKWVYMHLLWIIARKRSWQFVEINLSLDTERQYHE